MDARQAKHYLTPELIQEIQRQASDYVWKIGILAKFTKNWFDVRTVSPAGLIHFEGNSDTGWKHIMDRHGYFSFEHYFGEGAKGNPNKFSRKQAPMDDFRAIGDEVYMKQQKDLREHPDSDLFEKYKGSTANYSGSEGKAIEFNLILYKGTKIVHSIYPTKNIDGKLPKRVLSQFARDKKNIKATTRPCDDYYIFTVPYVNAEGITRYVAIFKIDIETKIARVYFQLNSMAGEPVQTTCKPHFTFPAQIEFPFSPFGDMPQKFDQFLHNLEFSDLSKLEKVIDGMESEIQEYIQKTKENNNENITGN